MGACIDHATGACSNPNKADGTVCDDGNANTVGDVCTNGLCVGVDHCLGAICTALDQCHAMGACIDHATGACSNPVKSDGSSCSSGLCQAGICVPAGLDAGVAGQDAAVMLTDAANQAPDSAVAGPDAGFAADAAMSTGDAAVQTADATASEPDAAATAIDASSALAPDATVALDDAGVAGPDATTASQADTGNAVVVSYGCGCGTAGSLPSATSLLGLCLLGLWRRGRGTGRR
jgi:hypothetical protein